MKNRRRGFAGCTALLLLGLAPPVRAELRFREVSAAWGIDFRHHHGGSGRRYMAETAGSGVVAFDYDGDGDEDLFFVDGGVLPGYEGETPRSRLFRNEGGSPPRFRDVTTLSGIEVTAYGMGGSAADVDGDGDLDLLVTELGSDQLFENRGDGSFIDRTAASGVADSVWSSSAAFADVDRDGDLDLYVADYLVFTPETHHPCRQQGIEVYCHPGAYEDEPDRFYRNRGDGTFEEATAAAGLAVADPQAGLGVVFADFNQDGWPDLYVADDADPNLFFLNRGDGTFEESALLSGVAYGDTGRPEAGMGVDAGDVDGDGRPDLVVTNFELETNALYRNEGAGLFSDRRFAYNVAEPSILDLGFGVAMADFDLDGDLDLAIANGHILDNAPRFNSQSRYLQANRVLENEGDGHFHPVDDAGLTVVRASRGLAVADLDGDFDLDLAISDSNDLAEVYENVGRHGGFLAVDLAGRGANTAGVGARVEARVAGRLQSREVRTSASFLSQSAMTLTFGLGPATGVDSVTVSWPSGRRQRWLELPAGRRVRLWEGATEK